jgi:probable F420-dependent oxidoreductase
MQIGVHVPTTVAPGVTREALLTFAREAEARDFVSLWVSDHIVIPTTTDADYPGGGRRFPIAPETPYLEPVAMLSALAMVTTKARIGCSVFILGHRHPVAMAKMLATIDVLSAGRLIVGVGVGWWRQELEILGVDFARRGRAADEALRVFKSMWTEREPRFAGKFYRITGAGAEPKPLQKPHPPIWVGGVSPAALRRVIALGDGWHAMSSKSPSELSASVAELKRLAEAAGRAWSTIDISMRFEMSEAVLAEGVQAVIDRLGEYARAGVRHAAVVFRRDDPKRMLELLDVTATKIRPALVTA